MSEAKHTQDTLIVLPPSAGVDANWHVTDKGDTFVAHVFGFGHAVDAQSEANARRIAACWNACEGLDTGLLKNITTLGDTLASRFRMRDKVERDLQAQRDELLEYLQYAVWAHPELEKNEKLMAVIAKATTHKEGQ